MNTITSDLKSCLPPGAPVFLCPLCQCQLVYEGSRFEGGSHAIDLSDRYVCPAGCGTYELVRQTRRLRRRLDFDAP